MTARITNCALTVIALLIVSLSGCNLKDGPKEYYALLGVYSGDIYLHISPEGGSEMDVKVLEIFSDNCANPIKAKDVSTEVMDDGIVKVRVGTPVLCCQKDRIPHSGDRFEGHLCVRYGTSTIHLRYICEYRSPNPPGPNYYINPSMILEKVTYGDMVFPSKKPDNNVDIKLRLRDNKLELVKP